MYKPESKLDYDKLLAALGTGFYRIQESPQLYDQVKAIWAGLEATVDSLYFNLYQAQIGNFLAGSGYLEDTFLKTDTPEKVYLSTPDNVTVAGAEALSGANDPSKVVKFAVQAKRGSEAGELSSVVNQRVRQAQDFAITPLVLTWDKVDYAGQYDVFFAEGVEELKFIGSSTELNPEEFSYTGQTPTSQNPITQINPILSKVKLNPAYTYIGLNLLKVNNIDITEDSWVEENWLMTSNSQAFAENLTVQASLYYIPISLTQIYEKHLGIQVKELFNLEKFPHFTELSTPTSEEELQRQAFHVIRFIWALTHYNRQQPTLSVIRQLFALYLGLPFAYTAGKVTGISLDQRYVTISGSEGQFTYDLQGYTHSLAVDQEISQFRILVTGWSVDDKYSSPTLLQDAEFFYYQLKVDKGSYTPKISRMYDFFIRELLPAGIEVVE